MIFTLFKLRLIAAACIYTVACAFGLVKTLMGF